MDTIDDEISDDDDLDGEYDVENDSILFPDGYHLGDIEEADSVKAEHKDMVHPDSAIELGIQVS